MKTKFINLLVSILYVPLLFVGQLIGNIIGTFLTPIILNFDLLWISYIFNLLSEILFMLIGGIIGGYVCGYLISKIYKNYNLFYISIFPCFVTICKNRLYIKLKKNTRTKIIDLTFPVTSFAFTSVLRKN